MNKSLLILLVSLVATTITKAQSIQFVSADNKRLVLAEFSQGKLIGTSTRYNGGKVPGQLPDIFYIINMKKYQEECRKIGATCKKVNQLSQNDLKRFNAELSACTDYDCIDIRPGHLTNENLRNYLMFYSPDMWTINRDLPMQIGVGKIIQ